MEQYWDLKKTNQHVNTSPFTNLAPSQSFIKSFKNIQDLIDSIENFNQNLNMNAYINQLTGRALQIAIEIRNVLVPQLETIGVKVENSMKSVSNQIKEFSGIMVQICALLKGTTVEKDSISHRLTTALEQAKQIQTILKNNVTPELDMYREELNQLISALGSEKIAIQDNNETLEQQRNAIIQKMHARTHTVCGVVKTIWDALTFQLEGELKREEAQLAQLRFQYNANSMAIGGATHMINSIKLFVSEVQAQSQTWDEFEAILNSLISDLDDLIKVHDHDLASLDIELIESDWTMIINC